MIARITGTLEHLDNNTATIAPPAHDNTPGPIAYEILVPAFVAEDLTDQTNTTVTLHTIQLFESHAQGASLTPRLLGFTQPRDRAFFQLFTTVKNLGPRKALRAMIAPPAHIAAAIAAKDAAALKNLPGVGARLAETIIAELAGKADPFIIPTDTSAKPSSTPIPTASHPDHTPLPTPAARDAAAALVQLGTQRPEAERRVAAAIEANPELAKDSATPDALLAAAFNTRP